MKIFATSLIAAIAAAQLNDTEIWPQMDVNMTEVETTMEDIKSDMFVLNDEGRLEFQDSLKDLPSLSFNNVDKSVITEWIQGNEDSRNEIADQWNSVWAQFVNAVKAPTRQFLDNAEDLDKADATLDLKTSLDISNFVTENVFVDGTSLDEMFPQIDEALAEYESWAKGEIDTIEYSLGNESHSLKRRNRKRPVTLQYYYEDDSYYNDSYHYDQGPTFFEKTAEKIAEIATANGYDQSEVDSWFSTKESAWKELGERQDRESLEMMQEDVKEASTYIKGIIDSMITEVRAKEAELNEELTQAVTDKLTEAKDQLDQLSQDQMDQAQRMVDDAAEEIDEAADMEYDELEASVSFKYNTAEVASESNNTQYGYGVLAMGAALATAAFLYKKNQKNTTFVDESEPLNQLDEDEEFQMV